MIQIVLSFMYILAFIFAILVICLLFDYNPLDIKLENKASMLSALGIIISAYIASLSVMVGINNAKKIEKEKYSKELKDELNILKFKTGILKYSTIVYEEQNKPQQEKNKKYDNCTYSRDKSYEFMDKLNSYDEFINTKIKSILQNKEILLLLQNISHNIGIIKSELIFRKEPIKKGITITAHVEGSLICNLEELEDKLKSME